MILYLLSIAAPLQIVLWMAAGIATWGAMALIITSDHVRTGRRLLALAAVLATVAALIPQGEALVLAKARIEKLYCPAGACKAEADE